VHQGSHSGVFKSMIQLNDDGFLKKRHEFWVKKIRRKYIYPLLGIDPRRR
jgi:predicted transcriptional regulator